MVKFPLLILRGTFNTGGTFFFYGVLYALRHQGIGPSQDVPYPLILWYASKIIYL